MYFLFQKRTSWPCRLKAAWGLGTAWLIFFIFLKIFGPLTGKYLPLCLFKLITGLPCPLCGTSQAFYHLGSLRLFEVLRSNALSLVLLIGGAVYLVFNLISGYKLKISLTNKEKIVGSILLLSLFFLNWLFLILDGRC